MTEVEKYLELIFKERIENMVEEVLSQTMIDRGHNEPWELGAFDKNWVKKIFVAQVVLHEGVKVDLEEIGEQIRLEMLDALYNINENNFSMVTIGREWGEGGKFIGTYVLSVNKDTLSKWEKLTDNNIHGFAMKYILENNAEPRMKGILISDDKIEIEVNI